MDEWSEGEKRQRIRKFMSGVLDSRLRPFTQNGLTGES